MTDEQINVALGLTVIVSVGAFLIYHVRQKASSSVVPPDGTVPNVSPRYANLPDFLKYNMPAFGTPSPAFLPNPNGQYSGSNSGGTLYGGPYVG